MICDPLTKAGAKNFADRLVSCMTSGLLDLEPTADSQLKKLKQQKLRQQKALGKTRANPPNLSVGMHDDAEEPEESGMSKLSATTHLGLVQKADPYTRVTSVKHSIFQMGAVYGSLWRFAYGSNAYRAFESCGSLVA